MPCQGLPRRLSLKSENCMKAQTLERQISFSFRPRKFERLGNPARSAAVPAKQTPHPMQVRGVHSCRHQP